MNTKVVVGVIVALLVLGGGIFLLTMRKATPANTVVQTAPNTQDLTITIASPSPAASGSAAAKAKESTSAAAVSKVMTVALGEQNESSESGIAVLTETGGQVKVVLTMKGAPATTPQPAHIHAGACPNPGAIKYPLTNVVNGKSETTLTVDMKTLVSGLPLAINVHKSAAEVSKYVACGDLRP